MLSLPYRTDGIRAVRATHCRTSNTAVRCAVWGITRVQPSVVETVISHDRYGIMLHNDEYPKVTGDDWLEFRQQMEHVIAIETVEIERIRSNIAAIEEIHSLIRSMEESTVTSKSRSDDDYAMASDDIESDMDGEYVEEHDNRYTSGFFDHKEEQVSGIRNYANSFFAATYVEEEHPFDGATERIIKNSDHYFANAKGWDAINVISDRCEAEYEYKQMLRTMPEGMRNRMPTE